MMFDPGSAMREEDLAEHLRAHDVLPTRQRLAIAGFFAAGHGHATAADVKAWVDHHEQGISLATVYNSLNCMAEAGILRTVRLPHTDHVIYDRNVAEHHHLLDEATGDLLDLPPGAVQVNVGKIDGYRVEAIEAFCRGRRG